MTQTHAPIPQDLVAPPGAPHRGPSDTDLALLEVFDAASAQPGEWFPCKGPFPPESKAAKTTASQANLGKRWVRAIAGRPLKFRTWVDPETDERYVLVASIPTSK